MSDSNTWVYELRSAGAVAAPKPVEAPQRYDRLTIAFHWATAALVLSLWVIGQTADSIPRGPGRTAYWSLHFLLGFALVALLAGRMAWRVTAGRRLPGVGGAPMRFIASATHLILYFILMVVIGFGIANTLVRGAPFFGLFEFPQLIDAAYKSKIAVLHSLGANLLGLFAALHAFAAFYHHFGLKDEVLRRMLPNWFSQWFAK